MIDLVIAKNDLLDKIASAPMLTEPFRHIYIENFLEEDFFKRITHSPDVALPVSRDVDDLFGNLAGAGYGPIEFPGCTKSFDEYRAWLESDLKPQGTHSACEAQGMALRCSSPVSEEVNSLDGFFKTPEFRKLIMERFGIASRVTLDCGLQKYLHGYEISPHPDIRQKALTWMLNINPGENTEDLNIHTHYMKFKPEWDFVREFWASNPGSDTCWVPWEWCSTYKRQTANNSLVIFAPGTNTLHAVRARYDHLNTQRTQFYGNLWYRPTNLVRGDYRNFAEGKAPSVKRTSGLRPALAGVKYRFVEWRPSR